MTYLSKQLTGLSLPLLYLRSRKTIVRTVMVLGSIVFLILLLLQPFGEITHGFRLDGILRIGSYALVVGMVVLLAECAIAPLIKLNRGQRWHYTLLWYVFEMLLVTTCVFLCKNAWMAFGEFTFEGYLLVLQRTMAIAVFPLLLLAVFLYTQKGGRTQSVSLVGDKTDDSLVLPTDSLLFLKSEDNYTRIVYQQDGRAVHKLLRGSLSHFEEQLPFPLLRVHRSYIVNLANISEKKGNSQGYQLSVFKSEEPLRVSRKYLASFDAAWLRLNS